MSNTFETTSAPGSPPEEELDTFTSATQLLEALRARKISSVELLQMFLQQIDRFNPVLNAIVYPDYDQARKRAEEADVARARGEEKPLLGLPYTLKDTIMAAGLPNTMGVTEFSNFRSPRDGLLAGRVKAAGGVLIGKTNIPPFVSDWQANNPIYGRTNNPWDLERTPGGSTGGGAAALAAGLTPLEFGSDLGGSIRVPAAFCGVYGHKPSETALARSGHFPGSLLPNPALGMGVQGPLARTAQDLELGLKVAAGPEVGEEVAWKLELPPARQQKIADLRVAVLPILDWVPVDDEIKMALENLVGYLSKKGAIVRTVLPEGLGDLREFHKTYRFLLKFLESLGMKPEERQEAAQQLRQSGDQFLAAEAAGLVASAQDFFGQLMLRENYRQAWRTFFKEWDILLAPIILTPAFQHFDPAIPQTERNITINGQSVPYLLQLFYPSLGNLSGFPATAFPLGLASSGLPIGLQAIGPYLEDLTPIRFAGLVAQEFGGFQAPPGYR